MVRPLTSEQIILSFGNVIIIVGVRARMVTQLSLFIIVRANTQLVIVGPKITLEIFKERLVKCSSSCNRTGQSLLRSNCEIIFG